MFSEVNVTYRMAAVTLAITEVQVQVPVDLQLARAYQEHDGLSYNTVFWT